MKSKFNQKGRDNYVELTKLAKKSLSIAINFDDMLVFAQFTRESFPSFST